MTDEIRNELLRLNKTSVNVYDDSRFIDVGNSTIVTPPVVELLNDEEVSALTLQRMYRKHRFSSKMSQRSSMRESEFSARTVVDCDLYVGVVTDAKCSVIKTNHGPRNAVTSICVSQFARLDPASMKVDKMIDSHAWLFLDKVFVSEKFKPRCRICIGDTLTFLGETDRYVTKSNGRQVVRKGVGRWTPISAFAVYTTWKSRHSICIARSKLKRGVVANMTVVKRLKTADRLEIVVPNKAKYERDLAIIDGRFGEWQAQSS